MSDTLILGNAALPMAPGASDLPAQGWAPVAQGVYWQGDADACAAAVTIDIVGVADSHDFEAHFLLLP